MLSTQDFFSFLQSCPTAHHSAEQMVKLLEQKGFTLLDPKTPWRLQPGTSYACLSQETLLAAFHLPKKLPQSLLVCATHIDSPALKLKPKAPLVSREGVGQLLVELYGAPIPSSWMDRDLTLAGRVYGMDERGSSASRLIHWTDTSWVIPQLAIHLDRAKIDHATAINAQDHLKALYTLGAQESSWEETLKTRTSLQKILGTELFLVPSQPPSLLGLRQEWVGAYRLDNLSSTYALLQALLQARFSQEQLCLALFWDHEEVGSMSSVGAHSAFASNLLERISWAAGWERETYYCLRAKALCLSADAAHGWHPNYPEKHDPQNTPHLGKGIALKFNANQKYATPASLAALLQQRTQQHNIPTQSYASRSDLNPGSTVGAILSARLDIPTIDLGVPLLAMHSARECMALQDLDALFHLFKTTLEEPL